MRVIEDLVGAVEGVASVYARRLDDDETVIVGDVDVAFPTGSAAKLAVLLALAARVADGSIDPHARVEMESAYRDARKGSGVLRHLAAGLAPTLHDCASLMMIVSDNVATDLLLDALGGPDVVNDLVAAKDPADGGNGSTNAVPTLRAQVSKTLFDAWY